MEEKKELEVQLKTELKLPAINWTKELELVREMTAKNCSETEFKMLLFMARTYNLNPLKKEIWAVKYQGSPALIFISRDGLISLAHRSKQFGSMETVCEMDPNTKAPVSATCTIYRKDYDKPFRNTVYFSEYNRNMGNWKTMPRVMLMKCAESTTLRRAFSIDGVLTPEEMPEKGAEENGSK